MTHGRRWNHIRDAIHGHHHHAPTLPTVRRVTFTNKKLLVAVVQSMKSHAAADFVLGGVAIGRVAWIRWVGWDDQIISGRR